MAKPNFTLPNKPAIKSGSILSYNYTDDFTFVPAPLTFNRDSAATRVNEKGLIEDVGYFGPELVQNGDFSEIGPELITNGDFSSTDISMITGAGTRSVVNGELKIEENGLAFSQVIYNGILDASKTYKATFDITLGTGNYEIHGTTQGIVGILSSGSYTFYLESTTRLYINSNGVGAVWYIDNVSVKEVGQNWNFGTGWSIKDGKAYYDGVENFKSLGQNNVVELGKKYRLNLDVSGLTNDIVVDVLSGNQFANPRYLTLSNGNVSFEFTSTNSLNNRFAIQAASGDEVYLDNISVIEVLGDKPRIDYSDSLTEPSLLLEPQSTNLIPYSEDFTQSVWNKLNCNVTLTSEVAPNGNANSVYNLTGTSANLYTSGSANIEHTISFYIKSNGQGKDKFKLRLGNNVSVEYTATNEWVRYEFTSTPTTSVFGITTTSAPNNEFDLLIWGSQLEQKSFPTSYIPTSGSTATRLGETANNAGDVNVFNSEEGVLYAEVAALADDGINKRISISDSTNLNRINMFFNGNINTYAISSNGAGNVITNSTNPILNNKIAISYNGTSVKTYINGSQIDSSTFGGFNSNTLDVLSFTNGDGNDPFYGKVKNLQVFNKALTDRELEILTIQ